MSASPQRSRASSRKASAPAPTRAGAESDAANYLERNRSAWERWAPYYRAVGRRAWLEEEPRWGLWGSLESELRLFSRCTPGMNAVELGCGTGGVCAWLTRAGLHTVGIDIAQAQLENALSLQKEFGLSFRLEQANAEAVPYEDASFDFAISEYGASVWCDPHRWIPEAARLLRPGGMLVFFVTSPFVMTCTPPGGGIVGEQLERAYFGMHRFDFASDNAVEFHLGYGDWFRALNEGGFAVEDLTEVRPGPHAPPRFKLVTNEWARRWPSESIWVARRR
jgi:ubiquinone/menaquinone biosynthesis C-methylase UbiE